MKDYRLLIILVLSLAFSSEVNAQLKNPLISEEGYIVQHNGLYEKLTGSGNLDPLKISTRSDEDLSNNEVLFKDVARDDEGNFYIAGNALADLSIYGQDSYSFEIELDYSTDNYRGLNRYGFIISLNKNGELRWYETSRGASYEDIAISDTTVYVSGQLYNREDPMSPDDSVRIGDVNLLASEVFKKSKFLGAFSQAGTFQWVHQDTLFQFDSSSRFYDYEIKSSRLAVLDEKILFMTTNNYDETLVQFFSKNGVPEEGWMINGRFITYGESSLPYVVPYAQEEKFYLSFNFNSTTEVEAKNIGTGEIYGSEINKILNIDLNGQINSLSESTGLSSITDLKVAANNIYVKTSEGVYVTPMDNVDFEFLEINGLVLDNNDLVVNPANGEFEVTGSTGSQFVYTTTDTLDFGYSQSTRIVTFRYSDELKLYGTSYEYISSTYSPIKTWNLTDNNINKLYKSQIRPSCGDGECLNIEVYEEKVALSDIYFNVVEEYRRDYSTKKNKYIGVNTHIDLIFNTEIEIASGDITIKSRDGSLAEDVLEQIINVNGKKAEKIASNVIRLNPDILPHGRGIILEIDEGLVRDFDGRLSKGMEISKPPPQYEDDNTTYLNTKPLWAELIGIDFFTKNPSYVNGIFQVVDRDGYGVTGINSDDILVKENGTVVSESESNLQIGKMEAVLPEGNIPSEFETVMLLDNSLSIGSDLDMVKKAAIDFVRNIDNNQKIALYSFSSDYQLLQEFTSDTTKLINSINKIELGSPSTNLYGSVIEALSQVKDTFSLDLIKIGAVVVFTDGEDSQGSSTLEELEEAREGKRVFGIGYGEGVNPTQLENIANAGLATTNAIENLRSLFSEMQAKLISQEDAYYWLSYISPKRGDNDHELSVEVASNNLDFELLVDFNSKGFTDATPGVLINANLFKPNGIDTVFVDINEETTLFAETIFPVTGEPEYSWELTNSDFLTFDVDPSNSAKAVLNVESFDFEETTLQLTDVTNNYNREFVVRMVDQESQEPTIVNLESPENDSKDVSTTPELVWNKAQNATSYNVQVSKVPDFSETVVDLTVSDTLLIIDMMALENETTYYWRVKSINQGLEADWSKVWSFETVYPANDITITNSEKISASSGGTVTNEESNAKADIPPNALTQDTNIETGIFNNPPEGADLTGILTYFGPAGTTFNEPVEITISYDANDLPESIENEEDLKIIRFNKSEGYWEELATTVETDNQLLTATTDHFSGFGAGVTGSSIDIPDNVTADANITFGDAGSSQDYRLVALPGDVSESLEGVLAGSHEADWQAFWDDGSEENYLRRYDGSEVFNFSAGNGFWITGTESFEYSETLPMVDINEENQVTISLHEGWNIISNPLDIDVSWSIISDLNGGLQPVWSFDGSFEQFAKFRSAKTGMAFYFLNDQGLNELLVPYEEANNSESNAMKQRGSGEISLITQVEGDVTSVSSIVFIDSEQQKRPDAVAPPGDFEEVSLRFVASGEDAGSKRSRHLARLYRPLDRSGQQFPLQLMSAENKSLTIRAEGLEEFPGMQAVLVDEATGKTQDLNADYVTITPEEEQTNFVLLLGTNDYVEQQKQEFLPKQVDVVPNYPNPFNPTTTLQFALPEQTEVRLQIYDVLGRRVSTLVDEVREAGVHTVNFNASHRASGMYFAVFEIGGQRFVQKMTLIK